MPIETFNLSFESTQNKQQYDTKITSTEVRGGGGGGEGGDKVYGDFKNVLQLLEVLTLAHPCSLLLKMILYLKNCCEDDLGC